MNVKLIIISIVILMGIVCIIQFESIQNSFNQRILTQNDDDVIVYELFQQFKEKYQKVYGTEEESVKMKQYKKNLDFVNESKQLNNLQLALNQFADLSQNEIQQQLMNIEFAPLKKSVLLDETHFNQSYVNWQNQGYVQVKDQMFQNGCKSSYAYSTVAVLENLNFLKTKTQQSFSEQQIIDCSQNFGNQGCEKGTTQQSLFYVQINGIKLQKEYRSTTNKDGCKNVIQLIQAYSNILILHNLFTSIKTKQ